MSTWFWNRYDSPGNLEAVRAGPIAHVISYDCCQQLQLGLTTSRTFVTTSSITVGTGHLSPDMPSRSHSSLSNIPILEPRTVPNHAHELVRSTSPSEPPPTLNLAQHTEPRPLYVELNLTWKILIDFSLVFLTYWQTCWEISMLYSHLTAARM